MIITHRSFAFLNISFGGMYAVKKKVSKKALGMNKHFIFNNPHPFNIAAILAYCHFCFLLFLLKTYLHNYVECNLPLRLFWGMRHLELHITGEDKAL